MKVFNTRQTNNFKTMKASREARAALIDAPPGYCYLNWLLQLGYPPVEAEMVANVMGPNPSLHDVVSMIETYHSSILSYRFLSRPRVVSNKLLHLDTTTTEVVSWTTLCEVLASLLDDNPDYKIGATAGECVSSDAAILCELLRSSGYDAAHLIREHIREEAEKPGSEIKQLTFKQFVDISKERQVVKNLLEVKHHYKMDPMEESLLRSAFPEIDIKTDNKRHHPHALAAIARKCEEALFMYYVSYFSTVYIPGGCDVFIKDIGGNARNHFYRYRQNVHSCCPVIDARDALRYTDTHNYMCNAKPDNPMLEYFTNPEKLSRIYCNQLAQNCTIKAKAGMFVHSMYDMTTRDIADALELAGCEEAWGSLIFDPRIIAATPESPTGNIKDLNMHWTVTFDKKRNKTSVLFGFIGDSSYEYEHSYPNYLALVSNGVFYSSRGTKFFSQITDCRLSTYHIHITKNRYSREFSGTIHHKIWTKHIENHTIVQYYELNEYAFPRTVQNMYYKINLFVPTNLVESGKMYAYSLSAQKFTLAAIFEYLRAINSRVVVNGVDVSTPKPVDADTLYRLAHAIYVYTFIQRYNQSKTLARITDNIKAMRASHGASFFSVIWEKITTFSFWEWITGTIDTQPGDIPFSADPTERNILAKIFFAFAVKDLFPVKISQAVSYYQFQTVLKQELNQYVIPRDLRQVCVRVPGKHLDEFPSYSKGIHEKIASVAMKQIISPTTEDTSFPEEPLDCDEKSEKGSQEDADADDGEGTEESDGAAQPDVQQPEDQQIPEVEQQTKEPKSQELETSIDSGLDTRSQTTSDEYPEHLNPFFGLEDEEPEEVEYCSSVVQPRDYGSAVLQRALSHVEIRPSNLRRTNSCNITRAESRDQLTESTQVMVEVLEVVEEKDETEGSSVQSQTERIEAETKLSELCESTETQMTDTLSLDVDQATLDILEGKPPQPEVTVTVESDLVRREQEEEADEQERVQQEQEVVEIVEEEVVVEEQVDDSVMSIVDCEGLEHIIDVPGDGSCMYHALIGALDLEVDSIQLRHLLATSVVTQIDEELRQTIYTQWGNIDVLKIAANHFGVDICVHEVAYTNSQFILSCGNPGAHKIHLRFTITDDAGHYNYYSQHNLPYTQSAVTARVTLNDYHQITFRPDITPIVRFDDTDSKYYIKVIFLYNHARRFIKCYEDKIYIAVPGDDVLSALKALKSQTDKLQKQRIYFIQNLLSRYNTLTRLRELFSFMTLDSYTRYVINAKGATAEDVTRYNKAFAVPGTAFTYSNKSLYATLFQSNHIHPQFKPRRRPNDHPLAVMRNAMDEIREYWKVKEAVIIETLSAKYKKVTTKVLSPRESRELTESAEGYGLMDSSGRWVVRPSVPKDYELIFDGKDLVSPREFLKQQGTNVGLVADALVLVQDAKLYEATEGLDIDGFDGVQIEFRQGVPGCGKTYNYLQTCRPPIDYDMGDLVLFPTRQGAEEFRRDIKKKYKMIPDKLLRRNYRTMDSYLLNASPKESYSRVLVDEALMAHAGQILLCVVKAKARHLIMIGDEKQIKFINRVPQCDIQYSDPCQFTRPTVHLSTSWRCTLTVAALLSDMYEKGMKAVSNVIGEMSLSLIVNLSGIKHDASKNPQYLVFKQSEKAQMISAGFKNTVTIHEYQGKQAKHIAVVRVNTKKEDIYSSEPHVLVAVSRHTQSFVYYTSVPNDSLSELVKKSTRLNLQNCTQYRDLKAGGGRPVLSVMMDHTEEFVDHEAVYSCGRKYGYPFVPLYRIKPVCELPEDPIFPNYVSCDPTIKDVGLVQEFYNYVFPNNAYHLLEFDTEQVLNSDIFINLEATDFNPQYKTIPKTIKFDTMRPVLQTSMPPSRPSNQVESLLAMVKRNQAVPALAGVVDHKLLAQTMFDRFAESYLIKGYKDMFEEFKTRPIQPNEYAVSEWLKTQPSDTINQIHQECDLGENRLTDYDFMIKSTVKPQLDHNAPFTYNALQTIAYQSKDINAMFCPIFREIGNRILPLLQDRFIVNTGMTMSQLEKRIRRRLRRRGIRCKRLLEIDMSKFDKSQGLAMIEFECLLMAAAGVDPHLINLWRNAHIRTTLRDRRNKVRCRVNYQRKSGDASTFIGNTFFLMAVLATLLDMSKVEFGIFAGDDSLLIGGEELNNDLNGACASLFNLESKFLRNYKHPYFCSKFLIEDGDSYYLIPDPMKLITKLGRRDLVNPEHVEQYRVSLCDIVGHYQNVTLHPLIDAAINERYNTAGSHGHVYSAIFNIIHDKEAFNAMFYSLETDNINYDPSLPKFD